MWKCIPKPLKSRLWNAHEVLYDLNAQLTVTPLLQLRLGRQQSRPLRNMSDAQLQQASNDSLQ